MDDFSFLIDLIDRLGVIAVLAWMVYQCKQDYRSEKELHNQTRREYREDLREIAGMRQSLLQVQNQVRQYNSNDTQPLPNLE